MSLPFFRNLVRMAVFSFAALGSAAFAQAGMGSDGYQFLEAVRDRDGAKVNEVVKDPSSTTILNARDKTSGETAMHIVAARRDTTWIRFLAKNGADPDLADREGVTPLMIAARLGHVIKVMTANGIEDVVPPAGAVPRRFDADDVLRVQAGLLARLREDDACVQAST